MNKNENDMKKIILSLIIALATVTAHAQLMEWQNISSNNFVMKIIHDQNFLYVGTKGGGIVKIDKQSGQQKVLFQRRRDDARRRYRIFVRFRWQEMHSCLRHQSA